MLHGSKRLHADEQAVGQHCSLGLKLLIPSSLTSCFHNFYLACLQFPLPVATAALEPEAAAGGIKAEPSLAPPTGAAAAPGGPAAAAATTAAGGTQQLMSAAASHPA